MSKELVERLRGFVGQYDCPDGVVDEAADLIERQTEMFDRLDAALCQFLNNAGDEYDPREWVPSVKRDLLSLAQVYNDCHKVGVMDLSRSAARHLTPKEGE